MIRFNAQFLTGAIVGVGITAGGYYLYKKNQDKVNNFLRSQGINVPCKSSNDYSSMSLETLVQTKEKLEDLIAEKEMLTKKETPA